MKTKTVTVREGELLGPVDWSYDFDSHSWGDGKGGANPTCVAKGRETLREVVRMIAEHGACEALNSYGEWQRVIAVGMYDGWPYWRPVPSVLCRTWMGAEWRCFTDLREARKPAAPAAEKK